MVEFPAHGDFSGFDAWLDEVGANQGARFSQDQLYELGGHRSAVLLPNRARPCARPQPSRALLRQSVGGAAVAVTLSVYTTSGEVAPSVVGTASSKGKPPASADHESLGGSRSGRYLSAEVQALLASFPRRQFVCKGSVPNLSLPGAIDLFSGKAGVARAMLRHGAPWVLTFELERSPLEDLNQPSLRKALLSLLSRGAFKSLGAAPVCASFSRAVRPPVRSRSSPAGIQHMSPAMLVKVKVGNDQNKWIRSLVDEAQRLGLAYWVENPDGAFFWLMPGWELERSPASPHVFRVDACVFGTPWRKRTRFATNTSLAGCRWLCSKKGKHLRLVGFSRERRKPWTRVAQTYPGGLADAIALAVAAKVGWTRARPLDAASCAKLGSCCRIGEAKKPGPGLCPLLLRCVEAGSAHARNGPSVPAALPIKLAVVHFPLTLASLRFSALTLGTCVSRDGPVHSVRHKHWFSPSLCTPCSLGFRSHFEGFSFSCRCGIVQECPLYLKPLCHPCSLGFGTSVTGFRHWRAVCGAPSRAELRHNRLAGFPPHAQHRFPLGSRALSCAALAVRFGNGVKIGEACNPGPPRAGRRTRAQQRAGDLEEAPLQSQASLLAGARAWSSFLVWVRSVVSFDPLPILPLCPGLTAMVLRAYGNFLYTSGAPIHLFRYTLVGAQRNILTLKGSLGPAWEILSRWEYLEPAVHRTPLPEALLRAFVVLSWFAGNRRWVGVTLLAFFGMARLGEVLHCRRRHLVLESDLLVSSPAVFLCLEASKTATRGRPKVQHLRIDDAAAMKLITLAFQHLQPEEFLYPSSAGAFRSRWDRCLKAFGLFDVVKVTPGGLRGGGAVAAYHRGLPVSDIQWRMRLKHQHTLEYYLQEVAALSALTGASPDAKLRIAYAAAIFEFLTSTSS